MPKSEKEEKERVKLIELIYDMFRHSCMDTDKNGKEIFNHWYNSTHEEAQDFLLKEGIITEDQCYYS